MDDASYWLTKMAADSVQMDDSSFLDSLDRYGKSDLQDLIERLDPTQRPTEMDAMQDKIAHAVRMGEELAQEREMKKEAILGTLLGAGARLLGGEALGAVAGHAAKDAVMGGIGSTAKKGVGALANTAQPTAAGGFNYKMAGIGSMLGSMGQRAAGYMVRNPGTAVTLGGAAAGAMMAPRDPQTGQKQYLRGALMGGGLAAGANALSGGAMGNKLRGAVMNPKSPLLGQGTRSYFMDAARATKGSYGKVPSAGGPAASAAAAPVSSSAAPAAAAQSAQPQGGGLLARVRSAFKSPQSVAGAGTYAGGPTMGTAAVNYNQGPMAGAVKVASPAALILQAAYRDKIANQQTLTYDPSTKTFIRQHMTPDTTMGTQGQDVIPAGHREPVARGPAGRGEYAGQVAPAGTPMGGGMSQVHSLHGGDVMSSAPGRGMMATPARAVPPPIPAAARMGGPAGLAGAATRQRIPLPSLAGAVSLARK